jgi:hypothetical protein
MNVMHLRLANGRSGIGRAAAKSSETEYCLIDYTHCPVQDTCWLLDLGSGCATYDGCIIDTN